MDFIYYALALLVGVIIGYIIVSIVKTNADKKKINSSEQISRRIIDDANKDADTLKREAILTAKDEIFKLKQNIEQENTRRKSEIDKHEQRLVKKEENLDKKLDKLDRKNDSLNSRLKNVEKKEEDIKNILTKQVEELERISSLTEDEAKQIILNQVSEESEHQKALILREFEARTREDQNRLSREIIASAIQRQASEIVAESSVSVVTLPNDEMKGRIIGREGRNIRAFESLTGVDLIIDDTPEAIVLSCYDPRRREIAKLTLEKLMVDGRIHPARIEEMYEKALEDIDQRTKEYGEEACEKARVHGLHPELVKILGKLNYRTSYGQNVLWHSVEVANIAAIIARELGINDRIARRAGLLHDIGKALDHDIEGTHVEIGVNLCRRYKIKEDIIHCIEAHHFDVPFNSLEAMVVQAADAISASRPGARREALEQYIQRLTNLENIANSYEGIRKAYAIQAGREIRVMVEPDKISDDRLVILSNEIAKQIENELEYPGKIKVHTIRETKSVAYAK
ncbi:ribonuclease Y [Helcococcus kunzii]|uniref:ribonuclease Y n=1 Tax=Helcococcus kunzii TaxID=40091 RepID=UPI0021A68069|nr:ribonuclease Y [Helcococcus kunzii]MCT1795448.1 ribonuclease Y [Helcococcus kunzii]MCT1989592.1 ribonuclease Y [Helcococcus kunzii]